MSWDEHHSKVAVKPFAVREDSVSSRRPALALRAGIASVFILLTMTACSFGGFEFGGGRSGGNAPPPQAPVAAVEAPKEPSAMDTFRALAPPEGMKFVPLFAEQIGDEETRFRRLEDAVQSIKNDFDTVTPSIVRLVAIEKDIKNLVSQLETLTDASAPVESGPLEFDRFNQIPREDNVGGTETTAENSRVTPEAAPAGQLPPEGAASPISNAPAAAVAAPMDIKPAPVPEAAPQGPIIGDVKAVRIGDHKDKTRIVLDMSAKPDSTATVSGNGKLLTIDLPQMGFSGAKTWEAMTAALVSGYRFEGGKLVLDLLYPSQIKLKEVLSPGASNPNYRLIIDLYAAGVHQ